MIEEFRKALDTATSQRKKLVVGTNEQDWQTGAKGLLFEAGLVIRIVRRATRQEYLDNAPDGYPLPTREGPIRFYFEIEILERVPYTVIHIPLPSEPTPGGRPQ
jgi:hypothetical protein